MFSLMQHSLQYASYALEVSLVVCLLLRGWWKRYPAFFVYVTAFAVIDAVVRPTVLYTYGWTSSQYRRCYWTTDIIITLGAFLLICAFFRRACSEKKDLWPVLRTMLISVFTIVAFISCFSISRNYHHLASDFVVELSQNVYFACLVLNTLLYIMLQYVECADESLNLLVCGLGIEFAGSAAGMAVAVLMSAWSDNVAFAGFLGNFCTVAMCVTWLYTVTRKLEKSPARSAPTRYRPARVFVEAPVHGTH
jgi:hypothetical protein